MRNGIIRCEKAQVAITADVILESTEYDTRCDPLGKIGIVCQTFFKKS